jgi:hypothetical protein
MSKEKTFLVKCPEGRVLPLPGGVARNATKKYVDAESATEVVQCSFVRRRVRSGDLLVLSDSEATAYRNKAAAEAKALAKKIKEDAAAEAKALENANKEKAVN